MISEYVGCTVNNQHLEIDRVCAVASIHPWIRHMDPFYKTYLVYVSMFLICHKRQMRNKIPGTANPFKIGKLTLQ